MIRQLTSFNETQFMQMRELMCVLSNHCKLTPDMLDESVMTSCVFVAEDCDRIIGTASLCPSCSPTGRKASIEDVVVLPEYQGRGIGRQLVEHCIAEARRLAPITLQLTSRPSRVAANALYRSLGFEPKETNVYKMALD